MPRTSRTHTCSSAMPLVTALAAALLCLFGLPQRAAQARAYTYGTGAQRTVNAGILLLDNNTSTYAVGSENRDPYVFYILNQRTDIKPYGWNIVNPLAPTAVTPEIQTRWDQRTNNSTQGAALVTANSGHAYQLGQNVTPAMAAYWEVQLSSVQITDLSQFDVLFLNVNGSCSFTAADTEKLRRFVDGGGTLWIENSSFNTTISNISSTAQPFFKLSFDGSTPAGGAYGEYSYLTRSPIITSPYYLSQTDMNGLGDKQIGNYGMTDTSTTTNLPGPNLLTSVLTSSLSNQPVIASGQYGAGQIIVTNTGSANTINEYVGGINVYSAGDLSGNSGPYCGTNLNLAPTADLKLLSNLLAAADAHPQALQNSHQNGASADPVSSPTQIWKDLLGASGAGNPPAPVGATVYGNLAYVTYGNTLYAFYIRPSQDPNPSLSLQQGYPYDIKWQATVGADASAPTVANIPLGAGSQEVVLVEKADGTVMRFNAGDGSGAATIGTAAANTYNQPAPAPTYYGSSIYAGGADGTLFVYNFLAGYSTSGGVRYTVSSATSGTVSPVMASPTVGIIPDGDGGNGNEIIALVTTDQYVYSVYLGARGEKLGGGSGTYRTKQPTNTTFDSTAPSLRTYCLNTSGMTIDETGNVVSNPTMNGFQGTPPAPASDPVYADYDMSFSSGGSVAAAGTITRSGAATASSTDVSNGTTSTISAPALDRSGNAYFTSVAAANAGVGNSPGSRIFSFHDAPSTGRRTMNWCFQLPRKGETVGTVVDADGTDYANSSLVVGGIPTSLAGFQFVGAPVTDGQGNVYALATNGTETAVLCFNTLTPVTADVFAQGLEGPVSGVQVVQPDPLDTTVDLFGNTPIPNITGGQITVGSTGHIDFVNFATNGPAGGQTAGLFPNLAEPYPVAIQYNSGDSNQAGNQTPPAQTTTRLHTNLSWYTIYKAGVSTNSGLTKAGNALFFVDSSGSLDQVIADPQAEGVVITSKFIPGTETGTSGGKMVTQVDPNVGLGASVAAPSVSNGTLVLVGLNGIAAYASQVTLVTDANRVLEMDSSGNAQWAVDATTRISLEGDTTPIYSVGSTGVAGTGQVTTTTLELNRPSSLTELTPNDYLIADTGNNRCVRFDRAGRVIWELTKFTDSATTPLLKPGEPNTLNQPTAVQIVTSQDTSGNTLVQYLISDAGNFRIVEVDDVYNSSGQPTIYHQLAWVSHTHDIQSREYRYQSASYYTTPTGNYVVALITNKRIAPLPSDNTTTGALAPANQDGEGGSIVFLTYNSASATNGYITVMEPGFTANLDANGKFDALNGTATPLYLRNPRYLKAYPTPGASLNSPYKNLLLADDNGAWDLQPVTGGNGYVARFGFTQADYRAMVNTNNLLTPISADGVTNNQGFAPRTAFPFLPSSIQLLAGTDTATVPSGTVTLNRYLISNAYSQGEAANAIGGGLSTPTVYPGFSGEVFEVDHTPLGVLVTGGYGGHTLSRPANTSPLSQPTFAYRLQ